MFHRPTVCSTARGQSREVLVARCKTVGIVEFLALEAEAGHFLIMDTGLGKTVTSLVYAYRPSSTGSKSTNVTE